MATDAGPPDLPTEPVLLRFKPACIKCDARDALYWKRTDGGEIQCIACCAAKSPPEPLLPEEPEKLCEPVRVPAPSVVLPPVMPRTGPRKNARSGKHSGRARGYGGGKQSAFKGRGRRSTAKKTPAKAPTAMSTPVTSDSMFYKGSYYQIGDIVSLVDVEGDVCYAQIRGFLQDQWCEKSAVITWLLPTAGSPPAEKCFDPATYILGPEEDIPRKLEYMNFIMHAPSGYFKDKHSPYPVLSRPPKSGFIWTHLGPRVQNLSDEEQ